jgi:hypothetical protein
MVMAQTCKTASINASTQASQFTDHKNGTLTDNNTGLMWKKCSEGQTWDKVTGGCHMGSASYLWQAALNQAQTTNNKGGFAGKSDWRVPNIKELDAIVEEQCNNPAINLAVFPATPNAVFWSSSPTAYAGGHAWSIHFNSGINDASTKNSSYQVRLVRSGQ